VDSYELVRRSVIVEGSSLRAAAREFGLDRRTVAKMVERPVPPGYRLEKGRPKPKLGAYLVRIEEILKGDETAPPKQRHTAKRIYERLREEGYAGCESQIRRAVGRFKGARPKEAFVPLVSVPGEAEADFGESWVVVGGVRQKARVLHMVLPHSGVWFARAYPVENAESFCDGHAAAFSFFGGVPRRIVYDNPAYAVNRGPSPMKGRERVLAQAFGELVSTYLFEPDFAAPGKGNEKGSVEHKVATVRACLFVPVPEAASWEDLNRMLQEKAKAAKDKAESFERDRVRMLALREYSASRLVSCRADKLSLVRFEGCSYSVPTRFVLRPLLVRATPFKLEILSGKEVVATHERCQTKGRVKSEISHYIDLLEQKPRAARTALPVLQAGLPDVFETYRRRVEDGTAEGDRRFVAVLKLSLDYGADRVARALEAAAARGVKDPSDIRLLVLRD